MEARTMNVSRSTAVLENSRAGTRGVRARRRGFTIIETMVVMTGVATILGICAVTIQLLLRLNSEGQARLNAAGAVERLASQFRADVHACDVAKLATAKAGDAASSLRLDTQRTVIVTYEARDGRVNRHESDSGKMIRRESYTLGRGRAVHFERRRDGLRWFATIVVSHRVGNDRLDASPPMEVLALEAKDRPKPSTGNEGQPK
jgi:type II secretory pathway pseudopilin PulG